MRCCRFSLWIQNQHFFDWKGTLSFTGHLAGRLGKSSVFIFYGSSECQGIRISSGPVLVSLVAEFNATTLHGLFLMNFLVLVYKSQAKVDLTNFVSRTSMCPVYAVLQCETWAPENVLLDFKAWIIVFVKNLIVEENDRYFEGKKRCFIWLTEKFSYHFSVAGTPCFYKVRYKELPVMNSSLGREKKNSISSSVCLQRRPRRSLLETTGCQLDGKLLSISVQVMECFMKG